MLWDRVEGQGRVRIGIGVGELRQEIQKTLPAVVRSRVYVLCVVDFPYGARFR